MDKEALISFEEDADMSHSRRRFITRPRKRNVNDTKSFLSGPFNDSECQTAAETESFHLITPSS